MKTKFEVVRAGRYGVETFPAGKTLEEAISALNNWGAGIKPGEAFIFGEWRPMLETFPKLRAQIGFQCRELMCGFGTADPYVGITLRETTIE